PDLFYRFGSPTVPYEDVPRAIGYIQKFDDAVLMAELGVVIQHLKGRTDARGDRIGITGFCVGGRSAFLTARPAPAPRPVARRPQRSPSRFTAAASRPTRRPRRSTWRTASSARCSASLAMRTG